MRTHHALQPRTPEQASYSIGRRDGKQFLKLYRSYLIVMLFFVFL